jgi:hypothetical protein
VVSGMEMTNVLYEILNVLCYLPESSAIVMLADNLTFLYPDIQSRIYYCCVDCTPFRAMSVLILDLQLRCLDSAKLPATSPSTPMYGRRLFPQHQPIISLVQRHPGTTRAGVDFKLNVY